MAAAVGVVDPQRIFISGSFDQFSARAIDRIREIVPLPPQ